MDYNALRISFWHALKDAGIIGGDADVPYKQVENCWDQLKASIEIARTNDIQEAEEKLKELALEIELRDAENQYLRSDTRYLRWDAVSLVLAATALTISLCRVLM